MGKWFDSAWQILLQWKCSLTNTDAGLAGFFGAFTDGTWGYAVPYHSGSGGSGHFGKVPRFRLDDFSTVQVLNLADQNPGLTGFYNGFTDGTFGYVMGYDNGAYHRTKVRFNLADFSTIEVRDFASEVGNKDHMTAGGFVHGDDSYVVTAGGKVIRFDAQPAAQATPPPSPSPTPALAPPGAGAGGSGASAVGDPHLQNVHGERFDLMKEGKHVLINIPRGKSPDSALLRVKADARRLGGQCADLYFQELNVTGSWAEAKQAGGYHYSVSHHDAEAPGWIAYGEAELKVIRGRTHNGLRYLNVHAKHLGRAGFAVGGLLGKMIMRT
ncbi:unnamed protein product [Prorocentrum cordatum]|uniref:Uncharacterized protein n=1 Tax=Prorocentrum cordatum TaxID=2364126 RepID=A0ABN9WBI7_9DINO|nr:unnamed protein product [Polarella glacialis]